MSSLQRDLELAIEKTLRENGIRRWELDVSSGHNKYKFAWKGKTTQYVCSSTTSDRRAVHRAVGVLRRTLGVARKSNKNPLNRTKPYQKRMRPKLKPPTITVLPDPWEKLKEVIIVDAALPAAIMAPVKAAMSPWRRALRRLRELIHV